MMVMRAHYWPHGDKHKTLRGKQLEDQLATDSAAPLLLLLLVVVVVVVLCCGSEDCGA